MDIKNIIKAVIAIFAIFCLFRFIIHEKEDYTIRKQEEGIKRKAMQKRDERIRRESESREAAERGSNSRQDATGN